ncbi:ABC transporter substrate-binding protein [Vibrio barjaei]|uniref:ABC transporter substrate-binding protein n=1 Tax=Vibrio barjaei TaxID=1676683 RepID=A0ABW7ILG4_9VIBR
MLTINKTKIALLISTGILSSTIVQSSYAANVPAGTKLAKKQEFVRGNGTEVATIDPQKSEGVPESNVIRDLLEGLVTQDANGETIPGVAESWDTPDNKTFTFHLRHNAKWSSGDPVTAGDFVYSFRRAVDPKTASPYAWYLSSTKMKNAQDIIEGKKDISELGVEAVDDYTLKVTLDTEVPYFVKMLAHTTMMPVHKATIEKWGEKWTKPEHFVGNGAYLPEKWVVNERLELKRNPNYWDNEHTVINKVTFLPIEDQVAEMNRFLSGEIQMTNEVPNEHFHRLQKEYPQDVAIKGNLCSYYYQFNAMKAPFNDVRVRKALSYAIDRDIITKAILGQGQKPAYFLTPEITAGFSPQLPEYGKLTQKQRDEKARALLAEAGYDKDHPLDFSLLYNTSGNHKKIAVAISSMWKKKLGVNVHLENQEWKSYLASRDQGNFDVTRAAWCGDYNEASTFLTLMMSDNVNGGVHYKSPAYDAIIDKALNSKSESERTQLYYDAEAQLSKDMPLAPIYQYVTTRLVSPQLGGYPEGNAEDKIYAKDLYIKAK